MASQITKDNTRIIRCQAVSTGLGVDIEFILLLLFVIYMFYK
jgi:hypothetical protein